MCPAMGRTAKGGVERRDELGHTDGHDGGGAAQRRGWRRGGSRDLDEEEGAALVRWMTAA
jgi:hypothetical protein